MSVEQDKFQSCKSCIHRDSDSSFVCEECESGELYELDESVIGINERGEFALITK